MWKLARQRMEKAKRDKYTIEKPKNYPQTKLEKGTAVWVNLNGIMKKAIVISDMGDTCIIEKVDQVRKTRYSIVGVHKSKISLRL